MKKQQIILRGQPQGQSIDAVRTGDRKQASGLQIWNSRQPSRGKPTTTSKCTRCRRTPAHDRRNCPARNATCRKCGKVGHYQVECRSKSVQEVEVSDTEAFLGSIKKANSGVDPWRIELKLEGCHTMFKIDTGADVTVVPKSLLKKMPQITLQQAKMSLTGPNQQKLPLVGWFPAKLGKGEKERMKWTKMCMSSGIFRCHSWDALRSRR